MLCYARSGLTDKAIEMFKEALECKIVPSKQLYTTLIFTYAQRKDHISAEKIVKEMKDKGLALDSAVYTNLMLSYLKAEKVEECWEVFRRADLEGATDQYLLAFMVYVCSHVVLDLL